MFRELFQYMTTPSSRVARSYGYVYASIALQERARRVQTHWQSHIKESKKFVLKNIPKEPVSIAILGSGPALEVPMQELLELGHRVYLVDMVHPKSVKKLWGKHLRVHFVEADLSGYTNGTLRPPTLDIEAQVWISANLWSQLALEPIRHLQNKLRCEADDQRLLQLGQQISTSHWTWLNSLSGRKLIFTDVERVYRNPEGKEIQRAKSMVSVADLVPKHQWVWHICPLGEDSKDYSFEMQMHAYLICAE